VAEVDKDDFDDCKVRSTLSIDATELIITISFGGAPFEGVFAVVEDDTEFDRTFAESSKS
jgi:hypothetical protein